jgi:hypothetical protein
VLWRANNLSSSSLKSIGVYRIIFADSQIFVVSAFSKVYNHAVAQPTDHVDAIVAASLQGAMLQLKKPNSAVFEGGEKWQSEKVSHSSSCWL